MPASLVTSGEMDERPPKVNYCRVVYDTVHTFWRSTSLAALSHSSRSPFLVLRVGWLLLFFFGVYCTVHDVLNVFESYFERPYSTMTKSENNPVMTFPAVTVCNQNRISCDKLVTVMLGKLQEDELSEYDSLADIYLLSNCGVETLQCYKTLQYYMEYFNQSGMPPDNLLNGDECLSCENIVSEWDEDCSQQPTERPQQSYDFWWQKIGCFDNISQSQDKPELRTTREIPRSLTQCIGASNNQQPSTGGGQEENSTDPFQPASLTRGFPYVSTLLDLNVTDSAMDSDVLEDDIEGQSYSGAIGLRDGLWSSAKGFSEVTNKTTTNPTSDKLRRKRMATGPQGEFYRPVEEGKEEEEDAMEASAQYNHKMNFLVHYVLLPERLKREVGYTFEDLILDCKFMGFNCTNSSFFLPYYSPNYGNCYIYNYEGNESLTLPGPAYSFSLVLNVHEDTYLPDLLTDKIGVKLAVHRPLTLPLLDEDGADLSPGMASSIGLKMIEYSRLEPPHGSHCTRNWTKTSYLPDSTQDIFDQTKVYSFSTCLNMCAQRMFMDKCDCAHPLLPLSFNYSETYYGSFKLCNLTSNHNDSSCMRSYLVSNVSYVVTESECDCFDACSEVVYSRVVSSSVWPPQSALESVHLTYKIDEKVTENLLAVEVFFRTLVADFIKETAQYPSIESLVSSLGGALSLYLGISIFLLVEFLELFFHLGYNSILFVMGSYKSPHDTPSPRQQTAKPSVTPSFPSKLPSDACITTTTTTTIGDLRNLRSIYGLERAMEALSVPPHHSQIDNLRDFKSHVFDGAFHR